MRKVDFLIVGCGLAGALLSRELLRNGFKIHVVDDHKENSASQVAIGLTNPITGKRLVKSWLIDDLLPKAKKTYGLLEEEFSSKYIFLTDIARIIPNDEIFEQWKPNFKKAVDEGYISKQLETIQIKEKNFTYFIIKKGFWVDVKSVVNDIKNQYKKEGQLTSSQLKYGEISITESVSYKDISAKAVIFSEGYKAIDNPFFGHLPFNLNKGEVAKAKIEDFDFQKVLKKNIFILPKENHYRIGATYDRENIDERVSEKATRYFYEKLEDLSLHADLFEQQVAIRPATVDRRPFVGKHENHENVFIFNGFGAKGVSLIPYFAEEFVEELMGKGEVCKEASTRRFFR